MSAIMEKMRHVKDGLVNVISGFGTEREKAYHNQWAFTQIGQAQLEAAFRSDWIARKGVVIPPFDMTREWRHWIAKDKQIAGIEAEERKHNLSRKTRNALIKARLYGGGALIMGVGKDDPKEELDVTKVKQGDLRFIHSVSRYEVQADTIETDVSSAFFGEPRMYTVQTADGAQTQIHPSRVVRFVGNEMPNTTQLKDAWGDSVLQAVDSAVKNATMTQASIAQLVAEAKVDVIKIPKLSENLATKAYELQLTNRLVVANQMKGVMGTLLLDKEEEWERINQAFSGLPDILRLYLLMVSGAFDIPATRFLGQSAVGLNSTGDGDLRNYYDGIRAGQTTDMSPALVRLDEVLIRSALGNRDEDIYYNWVALWQLDAMQKAEVNLKKAQAFKIDVDAQVIPTDQLVEARLNQLVEDEVYPGLDQIVAELDDEEKGNGEEPLDENDPEVIAQSGKNPDGTKAAPATEEVQKQALNGTQITSMQEIVVAVVEEQMPPETAKAILAVAFPTLGSDEINGIIDPLAEFEPKPKAPAIPFGQPGGGEQPGDQPKPEDAEKDDDEGNNVVPFAKKAKGTALEKIAATDAKPRTMYVHRKLVNKDEFIAWAKSQGFEDIEDDLHVTIVYCEFPVDWMKVPVDYVGGSTDGKLTVPPGGPRVVEELGPKGAIVLHFRNLELEWRNESIRRVEGVETKWPDYQPHVTIAYKVGMDTSKVKPYTGKLVFGPELFEEIKQ